MTFQQETTQEQKGPFDPSKTSVSDKIRPGLRVG